MKIKRTENVYSIKIPDTNKSPSFFEASTYSKLYFKSYGEAQLYQQLHYPNLSIADEKKVAILDQAKNGDDRWVLLNLMEDMRNSNANKEIDNHSWDTDSGSGFGGPSGSKITYDCSDTVDATTRFLYVDNHDGLWFVERGPEINMTAADDLVLRYKLEANKSAVTKLLAEQEAMERELHQFKRYG